MHTSQTSHPSLLLAWEPTYSQQQSTGKVKQVSCLRRCAYGFVHRWREIMRQVINQQSQFLQTVQYLHIQAIIFLTNEIPWPKKQIWSWIHSLSVCKNTAFILHDSLMYYPIPKKILNTLPYCKNFIIHYSKKFKLELSGTHFCRARSAPQWNECKVSH